MSRSCSSLACSFLCEVLGSSILLTRYSLFATITYTYIGRS
jgi:hypothetical protein